MHVGTSARRSSATPSTGARLPRPHGDLRQPHRRLGHPVRDDHLRLQAPASTTRRWPRTSEVTELGRLYKLVNQVVRPPGDRRRQGWRALRREDRRRRANASENAKPIEPTGDAKKRQAGRQEAPPGGGSSWPTPSERARRVTRRRSPRFEADAGRSCRSSAAEHPADRRRGPRRDGQAARGR